MGQVPGAPGEKLFQRSDQVLHYHRAHGLDEVARLRFDHGTFKNIPPQHMTLGQSLAGFLEAFVFEQLFDQLRFRIQRFFVFEIFAFLGRQESPLDFR